MPKNIIAAGDKATVEAAQVILEVGGNAYDAAVAACFTAMVAEPALTSAGGGGFLNAYPDVGKPTLFDFFVNTPSREVKEADLDFFGILVDFGGAQQEFHIGKGSVGVPGNVAGLLHVHDRLGSVPLREVLQPAILAAKEGVILAEAQAYLLEILEPIMTYDLNGRSMFAPNGTPLKTGDRLKMPEFADFLDVLWREGSDLFYKGDVAKILVASLKEGGLIEPSDLRSYAVEEREPQVTSFHGFTVLGNPPPALSGVLIDFTLSLLEAAGCTKTLPISISELAQAFEITNKARQDKLHEQKIDASFEPLSDRRSFENYVQRFVTLQQTSPGRDVDFPSAGATTHISVLDKSNNAVSVTTTNGAGSGFVIPQCGIMMNNMLGEEDLNPAGFHCYDGGERLASMIAPLIVLDRERPVLITGSAGSNRIRSAVIQIIINNLCNKMAIREVTDAPRIHLEGNILHAEPGVPESDLTMLADRYHIERWEEQNLYFGGANSVTPDGGAGDPRRGGYSIMF